MSDEVPVFQASKTERPIGDGDGIGPGHINIGGGFFDGHYPSNLCVEIKAEPNGGKGVGEQLNEYFQGNPGMVVTGVFYSGHSALVFHTRILTKEEVDQFNRLHNEVRAKMNEEDQKRALAQAESNKRAAEAEKEAKRLTEVGRKCEANHKKAKADAED